MAKLLIIVAALVAIVIGGGIFLANWNIPAPTSHVEKPLSNDKLPE